MVCLSEPLQLPQHPLSHFSVASAFSDGLQENQDLLQTDAMAVFLNKGYDKQRDACGQYRGDQQMLDENSIKTKFKPLCLQVLILFLSYFCLCF